MTEENNYDNIKKDFVGNTEKLRKQITNIEIKQQDLQQYITTIDNAIIHLEQMIQQEQNQPKSNNDKIRGLRSAVSKNVELIANLYNAYKEFETVKFRYFKEVDDNSYRMHRLIELEMKKVDENANKLGQEFYNMMRNLSTISSDDSIEESEKKLEDQEYSL